MKNNTEKQKTTVKTPSKGKDAPMRSSITKDRDESMDDQGICLKAPEWAEHQRLWDDDMPCDDGRIGDINDE